MQNDQTTNRRQRAADALNLALAATTSDSEDNVRSPSWSESNDTYISTASPDRHRQMLETAVSSSGLPERPVQRRAASANQVQASASSEHPSAQATFESPLRSILVSSPPTASVSANTALASLSAAAAGGSNAGPFAALTGAGARRPIMRSDDVLYSPPQTARPPLVTLEKDPDDPHAGTSLALSEEQALNTTLSRLFAVSDVATPATISRFPSHLRSFSGVGKSLNDTSTLTGHLFHNGFQEGKHSDITIIAFGESYKLHKLLLDRIPFFSSAFSGGWAESSAKEMEIHPEEIDSNITKLAFELAIKRVYGTQFPVQEEQEAIGLFATACWLNIPDLVESCVDAILRQMQPSTLHHYILMVTTNYYGKPGDRVLASAKAMLYREGWEMDYSSWDEIPSDLIREIIGGDPFFVPSEWERWYLTTKILNRKLKAQAIELGLVSAEGGQFLRPRPIDLSSTAIRIGSQSRQRSREDTTRTDEDSHIPWLSLYKSPEISPLLILLDEGIHYIHLRFEQLQQIRSHRDVFGVPTLPEKVISDSLWSSMVLRQRILNAHDSDLELGLAQNIDDDDGSNDRPIPIAEKGKGREHGHDVASEHHSDRLTQEVPQRYWIPSDDVSCVLGGTREAHAAASAGATDQGLQSASRVTASLESPDMTWLSSSSSQQYSQFPPFRFSAEFPNPRTLKEKKRMYSKTFWYAGSLWNLYVQKVYTSKNQQLGIYLHRAKETSPTDDPLAQVVSSSVDDRIGQLEREMLLRKTGRRSRPWQDLDDSSVISNAIMESRTVQKDEGIEQSKKEDTSVGQARPSSSNMTRLFDSDEEEDELLRWNRRQDVPTMPPYVDTRPVIKTYFKIYSPDKNGRLLSIYESAPEKFVVSKSWGWKSSQMVAEDGMDGHDLARGPKETKLRYMVVIGNV